MIWIKRKDTWIAVTAVYDNFLLNMKMRLFAKGQFSVQDIYTQSSIILVAYSKGILVGSDSVSNLYQWHAGSRGE